jgi:hypothetical protein
LISDRNRQGSRSRLPKQESAQKHNFNPSNQVYQTVKNKMHERRNREPRRVEKVTASSDKQILNPAKSFKSDHIHKKTSNSDSNEGAEIFSTSVKFDKNKNER